MSTQESVIIVLAITLIAVSQGTLKSAMFRHLRLFGLLLATISPCLGMSTLAFNGSIIADDFLLGLSPKLPQLDTLILDTCSYIMDAPYNLKIFLMSTRLNKLQLQFDSF